MAHDFRLLSRIIRQSAEIYFFKVVTLAIAFASGMAVLVFCVNEFATDRFSHADDIFRVLQKNTATQYDDNRLSNRIPPSIYRQLPATDHEIAVSRIKTLAQVSGYSARDTFFNETAHAADPAFIHIFPLSYAHGSPENFAAPNAVLLSERKALQFFGTTEAARQTLNLISEKDTLRFSVAAVFHDLPSNTQEQFEILFHFDSTILQRIGYNGSDFGVFIKTQNTVRRDSLSEALRKIQPGYEYLLQPLTGIYFGPRVTGESVTHGDEYSIQVLIGVTAVIFLLALANFIVLSMMTLPGRSKEFAIKKVAGATAGSLIIALMVEYLLINLLSFLLAVALLALVFPWIESGFHIDLRTLVFRHYIMMGEMMMLVIVANAVLPLTIAFKFTRPAPGKLLGTDTLTFPVLKKWIATIQLGICFGLLITTFIIRKQVSRSLLKEPGRNHDQVVIVRYPRKLTDTEYNSMKKEFQTLHPNVIGIIAVSHLPGDIQHKALHAENFTLYADRDLASFFRLRIVSGHWFTDYDPSISYLVNETMKQRKIKIARGTQIGVLENFNERFNQPEKPVLITRGSSEEFNFILARIYEVDIRKTMNFLSRYFSRFGSEYSTIHLMDKRFERWIRYEDQLSAISGLLISVSVVITCLATYSLSLSQARDKTKTIAIHKMFGATIGDVARLLTRSMLSLQLVALAIFLPLTYLLMQEWLRHFVYAARLEIMDIVVAFGFDLAIIALTCSTQASRLNRVRLTDAVKA